MLRETCSGSAMRWLRTAHPTLPVKRQECGALVTEQCGNDDCLWLNGSMLIIRIRVPYICAEADAILTDSYFLNYI